MSIESTPLDPIEDALHCGIQEREVIPSPFVGDYDEWAKLTTEAGTVVLRTINPDYSESATWDAGGVSELTIGSQQKNSNHEPLFRNLRHVFGLRSYASLADMESTTTQVYPTVEFVNNTLRDTFKKRLGQDCFQFVTYDPSTDDHRAADALGGQFSPITYCEFLTKGNVPLAGPDTFLFRHDVLDHLLGYAVLGEDAITSIARYIESIGEPEGANIRLIQKLTRRIDLLSYKIITLWLNGDMASNADDQEISIAYHINPVEASEPIADDDTTSLYARRDEIQRDTLENIQAMGRIAATLAPVA